MIGNIYTANLNRIEFVITNACTGRCKHCSEGDHAGSGPHIDPEIAAGVMREVSGSCRIESVMTFGGEPMLYPEAVYAIHTAAAELGIPKRQLITNGYFTKDAARIKAAAEQLLRCRVNDILLSADAFHQETIPLEPVKRFAAELLALGLPLRMNPAWLVSKTHDNLCNNRTREILAEFEAMGIAANGGNVIFPEGNALKYFGDYFESGAVYINPYEEDPADLRTLSIDPDGSALGGNVYKTNVLMLLNQYHP